MTLRDLTLPAVAVLAFVLAAPAAAQQASGGDEAPVGADASPPTPQNPRGPTLFGGQAEAFTAEEFYWMNPEADRWPNDLDPRGNEYLPSPEPAMTFELDLDL